MLSDTSACTDEMLSWLRANRLHANLSKAEVPWCSSGRRQHQIPTASLLIGTTHVLAITSVRDLGLCIDLDVSMRAHVIATVRSCCAALYDNSAVCDDVSQIRPCWRSSELHQSFLFLFFHTERTSIIMFLSELHH